MKTIIAMELNMEILQKEQMILKDALDCPFCGSWELRTVDWADDEGEYIAIECKQCRGCAPAGVWNRRAMVVGH